MSLELAAQIVNSLRECGKSDEAMELFCHFELHFKLSEQDSDGLQCEQFAIMCGYMVASDIQ